MICIEPKSTRRLKTHVLDVYIRSSWPSDFPSSRAPNVPLLHSNRPYRCAAGAGRDSLHEISHLPSLSSREIGAVSSSLLAFTLFREYSCSFPFGLPDKVQQMAAYVADEGHLWFRQGLSAAFQQNHPQPGIRLRCKDAWVTLVRHTSIT